MHAHEASIKGAVAILTVSDSRSTTEDQSGAIIADCLEAAGHQVIHRELVRDEETEITIKVSSWSALLEVDAIVVTGGTGASPRDVTPEAILPVFSAKLSGVGEVL
jgi:molybdenum cofactor biosynthesis protein B